MNVQYYITVIILAEIGRDLTLLFADKRCKWNTNMSCFMKTSPSDISRIVTGAVYIQYMQLPQIGWTFSSAFTQMFYICLSSCQDLSIWHRQRGEMLLSCPTSLCSKDWQETSSSSCWNRWQKMCKKVLFIIYFHFKCQYLFLLFLQLPGRKDLFIDADLMSPLDRIANVTILKVCYPIRQGFGNHLQFK